MSNSFITLAGPALASRSTAAPVREQLLADIHRQGHVVVDLQKVDSISESYADELFGVLVQEYGLEWFLDHIELRNADEYVLRSVAVALRRRSTKAVAA